jgi:transcriptional regulator, CopG family
MSGHCATCVTASFLAEVAGINARTAFDMLLSRWRRGEYDLYKFTRLSVFCRPGAEPVVPFRNGHGWAYVPVSKMYEEFVEVLRNYKSRRAVVKVKTICERLGVKLRVCSSVVADVLHAAGVKIVKCSEKLCAVVDDVQEFLSNNGSPPTLVPYLARREVEVRRRAVEKMELISFHLPRVWLEEIDRLVAQGKYETRSEFVREAIRQLLEKYDHLRA